jgi:hypothetical protein
MCDKCKEIHLKVQTTIEHEILDIKSSGGLIDVQLTVICTDNIRCQIHKSKFSCSKYNQAWGMVHYIEGWYIDGNWYIEIKYNYYLLFVIKYYSL